MRLRACVDGISCVIAGLVGTTLAGDLPLMSAGLDSIGATELARKLGNQLETEISSTLLFDHPSVNTVASALACLGPFRNLTDVPSQIVTGGT